MHPPQEVGKFLWYFINKQRLVFFCLAVVSLAKTFSNTIWPVIIGNIIDQLNKNDLIDKDQAIKMVSYSLLMACGFWLLMEVMTRTRGYLTAHALPRMEANMRTEIFHKVSNHSYHYFVNSFMGSIGRKIAEIPRSSSFIIDILLTSIQPLLVAMLISAYICFSLNSIIASILLFWMLIHICLTWFFCRKAAHYSALQAEAGNKLQGRINDSLANNLNVKLFNSRRYEFDYIQIAQAEEQKKNIKSYLYVENVKIVLSLVSSLAMFAIFYITLQLWHYDKISLGETIIIFNLVANLMMQLWTTADDLTYLFQELGICRQGLTVLQDHIGKVRSTAGKQILKVEKGKIEFHNVTFNYRRNNNLFNNQSITIEGGQKIGLVGFSGSGKTTFANLILRLYEVEEGEILIDGQNITSVTEESLHNAIAMITQETMLFHRSIFENIRYGKFDATLDEVEAAAKRAHCHDFIMKMEKGYNTIVGERGTSLSGGQRQRLGIARAILKKAKIVILDEATSALDSLTEQKIKQGLDFLIQGNTALIIAHRLSTLLDVDRILVFDNGSIVEDGSHTELLAINGLYAKLWQMQNNGILPNCELLAGEEEE